MYTECSSCHTYFKITPAQLKAADGKVRCGSCGEVFNALDSLTDVVPPVSAKSSSSKIDETASLNESLSAMDEVAGELGSAESGFEEVISAEESIQANELDGDLQTAEELGSLQLEEQPELDQVSEDSLEMDLPATDEPDIQEEINKDIDDALNDLFNDDELQSKQLDASAAGEFKENSMLSAVSVFGGSDMESSAPAKGNSSLQMKDEYSSLDLDDQLAALDSDVDLSKPGSRLDSSGELEPSAVDFDLSESELANDSLHSQANKKSADSVEKASDKEKKSADDYVLDELKEKRSGAASTVSKVAWIILILFLLTVLLVQFAYLKRAELVKYPEFRPVLETMCKVLSVAIQCDIPNPRDTDSIALIERNVVSHPTAENALLITSIIRNNAEFVQPYPKLVLTFSDINQKVIARRTFVPTEYLTKDVDIAAGMAPSVPIKVMLEIVDPGQEAVNFEFDFK